jgi:hypothetical protein
LIHKILHFNDNAYIEPEDRLYKVRPLIEQMNKIFTECLVDWNKSFSLDEAMKPYNGHSSLKQLIRGKPVRFGFKAW